MNLEQLRKQAKELVRAARAGDEQALERLGGREPILARAQLVLAREHGYPSWPALVAAARATGGRRARGHGRSVVVGDDELVRDSVGTATLNDEFEVATGAAKYRPLIERAEKVAEKVAWPSWQFGLVSRPYLLT